MAEFARFLEKLQGDSRRHRHAARQLHDHVRQRPVATATATDHDDLPIILAGRGGGTIDTGRASTLGDETPLNNLFLSMLDRMGAGVPTLGDSTRPTDGDRCVALGEWFCHIGNRPNPVA